jgi:hypothetical protein
MKVLTKLEHANGDKLIKELGSQGFFDDLPNSVRNGFMDQVLKALPFLRNKLGGHGQGAAVVDIPPAYGDLAIQIAAAFQNFLITKHLVSVRKVLESYESSVIQEWWPDSRRGHRCGRARTAPVTTAASCDIRAI